MWYKKRPLDGVTSRRRPCNWPTGVRPGRAGPGQPWRRAGSTGVRGRQSRAADAGQPPRERSTPPPPPSRLFNPAGVRRVSQGEPFEGKAALPRRRRRRRRRRCSRRRRAAAAPLSLGLEPLLFDKGNNKSRNRFSLDCLPRFHFPIFTFIFSLRWKIKKKTLFLLLFTRSLGRRFPFRFLQRSRDVVPMFTEMIT